MCNKNCYTKKEALSALNFAKSNRAKKYRNECRIYQCPDRECNNMYHLTSKEQYDEIEEVPLKLKDEWDKLIKKGEDC